MVDREWNVGQASPGQAHCTAESGSGRVVGALVRLRMRGHVVSTLGAALFSALASTSAKGQVAPNTSTSSVELYQVGGPTACYVSTYTQTGSFLAPGGSNATCPAASANGVTGTESSTSTNATRSAAATTQLTQTGTPTAEMAGIAQSVQYSAVVGVSTPTPGDNLIFHFFINAAAGSSSSTSNSIADWQLQVDQEGTGHAVGAGDVSYGDGTFAGSTPGGSINGAYDLTLALTNSDVSGGTDLFYFFAEANSYLPAGGASGATEIGSISAILNGIDAQHADGTTYASGVFNPTAGTWSLVDVTTTPEPSSLALLGTGLVGLVPFMRRRRSIRPSVRVRPTMFTQAVTHLTPAVVSLALLASLPSSASAQSSYGQTFTAPNTPNVELTFINLGYFFASGPGTSHVSVFGYSGNQIAGSSLFDAVLTGPFNGDTLTFTPNVALSPGGVYVVDVIGGGGIGTNGDTFAGGDAVRCGFGTDPATTCRTLFGYDFFGNPSTPLDVADFDVRFTTSTVTTPEPSSLALLGTGLVGLVPLMRRRQG